MDSRTYAASSPPLVAARRPAATLEASLSLGSAKHLQRLLCRHGWAAARPPRDSHGRLSSTTAAPLYHCAVVTFVAASICRRRRVGATWRQCLPVREVLGAVLAGLRAPPHACVLVAPPGAGKTTAVPLALLDAAVDVLSDGLIIVTEPRRVAARAAACRMATMRGEVVGETVGFRTRFERCLDKRRTRIQVVTDGVLTGQLQADPSLLGVSAVVLDEFHERGLSADLNLALCVHARAARRNAGLPPLRLIVMSATLAPSLVARLEAQLGGAAVVTSEGRAFNVDVRHVSERRLSLCSRVEKKDEVERAAATAVRDALRDTDGNVLCFMPGEYEIKRTVKLIEEGLPKKMSVDAVPKPQKKTKHKGFGAAPAAPKIDKPVDVLPLYGSMDAEIQDWTIRPGDEARRRVVVATNIAEASITVDGVTAVVDAGLRKRSLFTRGKGMNVLETVAISQASADQRAGRAGRMRDGICLRLWSASAKLQPEDTPEVAETDLTGTVLSLAACGVLPTSIAALPWLDVPPAASIEYAARVLQSLGALEADGSITAHGAAVARLPLHPRLGHMALSARPATSAADRVDVADLCALLEEDHDVIAGATGAAAAPTRVDIRQRLLALRGALDDTPGVKVLLGRCAQVRRVAADVRDALPAACRSAGECGILIARAFPERVAMRVTDGAFDLRDGTTCFMKDPAFAGEECLAVARVHKGCITLAAPLSVAGRAALLTSALAAEYAA